MKRGRSGIAFCDKYRGFTLIELVVTVGIILVLLALLFPVLTNMRKGAQQAACTNNLRQLGVATRLFTQDNNGYMPDIGWWAEELLPYLGGGSPYRDVFWCPAATKSECPINAAENLSVYASGKTIPISYGINANYPANNGQIFVGDMGTRTPPMKTTNINNGSQIVLYTDQAGGYGNVFYNTQNRFSLRHSLSSNTNQMQLNGVFVDGHVAEINQSYNTTVGSSWRYMFDGVQ